MSRTLLPLAGFEVTLIGRFWVTAEVLCLTPENLTAPWILFEAGALSKTLDDSLLCPYLFGVEPSAVEWPLAQFQLDKADKQGTRKLLTTINNVAADAKLDTNRLDEAFDMWWPHLEKRLAAVKPSTTESPTRSDRALLEDILEEIRSLARRDRIQDKSLSPVELMKLMNTAFGKIQPINPEAFSKALTVGTVIPVPPKPTDNVNVDTRAENDKEEKKEK